MILDFSSRSNAAAANAEGKPVLRVRHNNNAHIGSTPLETQRFDTMGTHHAPAPEPTLVLRRLLATPYTQNRKPLVQQAVQQLQHAFDRD